MRYKLYNTIGIFLFFGIKVFSQAPPPPPGGPGTGDPPIGGTVPVDDGLIFMLAAIIVYAVYNYIKMIRKNRKEEAFIDS